MWRHRHCRKPEGGPRGVSFAAAHVPRRGGQQHLAQEPPGAGLPSAWLQQPDCLVSCRVGWIAEPTWSPPSPALSSPGASGAQHTLPGISLAPRPRAGCPSGGHCHFSSRHPARPHLHYNPDGLPQPCFPELPATLMSVPGRRRGHSATSGHVDTIPTPAPDRAAFVGLGSGEMIGWKLPPLIPYPPTQNLEQMWIPQRHFSPLPDAPSQSLPTGPPPVPSVGRRMSPAGQGPEPQKEEESEKADGWVADWVPTVFSLPSLFLGNARGRLGLECQA